MQPQAATTAARTAPHGTCASLQIDLRSCARWRDATTVHRAILAHDGQAAAARAAFLALPATQQQKLLAFVGSL